METLIELVQVGIAFLQILFFVICYYVLWSWIAVGWIIGAVMMWTALCLGPVLGLRYVYRYVMRRRACYLEPGLHDPFSGT